MSTCFGSKVDLNCNNLLICWIRLGLPTVLYVVLNEGRSKFSGMPFDLEPASTLGFVFESKWIASGFESDLALSPEPRGFLVSAATSSDCGLCLLLTLFGTPPASSTTAFSGLDCNEDPARANSPISLPGRVFSTSLFG